MADDPNRKRPPYRPKPAPAWLRCGGCGKMVKSADFLRHARKCDRERQ